MPVIKKCVLCSKEYKTKPSHAERRRYCSKKCQGEAITTLLTRNCIVCGEEFKFHDNQTRRDAKYCSQVCKGKDSTGENHWNYKGPGNRLLDDPGHRRKRLQIRYHANDNLKNNIRKHRMKRERNLVVGHHFGEWIELLKKYDNLCFYCGIRMTKTPGIKQRTRDHMVPVSRGGSDKLENIVPACRSCNSKKGALTFDEFKEKLGKVNNDNIPPFEKNV